MLWRSWVRGDWDQVVGCGKNQGRGGLQHPEE